MSWLIIILLLFFIIFLITGIKIVPEYERIVILRLGKALILSVISVENLYLATQGLATTTLRAVIGDIILDDVLSKREEINQKLQMRIDEVTQRWGVKVTAVEIREIIPPKEIQEAMTKQMAAERNRRAMITEAEGIRQSEILKAEGEKQSQILRAEGYALALSKIYEVAKNIDPNTIALENISNSSSTKIIFPKVKK